jgi:hypothetical protein
LIFSIQSIFHRPSGIHALLRKISEMNSIVTVKLLSSKERYAGRNWFYQFRELHNRFNETKAQDVAQSLSSRYSQITKTWNKEKNSEWLCRTYLAAKMVMAATLQINTLNFSESKNIRLTTPYLTYYSILALLRAIVYTIPEQSWEDGKLTEIPHQKAINVAFDHIALFDRDIASSLKAVTLKAKANRELISYRLPTSGDAIVEKTENFFSIATLLAEIAQFNSEILEASVEKNAVPSTFEFLDKYIENLTDISIEGVNFFDSEDLYRLDYLSRKFPKPPNILHTMTEGHVEDFFGAWTPKEELEGDDGLFDPDENWQIIFDIP